MAAEKVWVYNEISGVSALVDKRLLDHPTFGEHIREVKNGKKRVRLTEPAIEGVEADEVTETPEQKED